MEQTKRKKKDRKKHRQDLRRSDHMVCKIQGKQDQRIRERNILTKYTKANTKKTNNGMGVNTPSPPSLLVKRYKREFSAHWILIKIDLHVRSDDGTTEWCFHWAMGIWINWMVDRSTASSTDWLIDWLTELLTGWLSGWLIDWLTGCFSDPLLDPYNPCKYTRPP